jgi:2-polyprenyl-3-methyl-5-hydroxy-6-metoxy-1,4-benzoquinol methylase
MSYDLWGRLRYVLSPQFDIYENVAKTVHGAVADIGSGTGLGTHLLARNAKLVVGYEVDDAARDFANRTFLNENVVFAPGDITKMPIREKFDYITMIDVIEHIRDDYLALEQVKKMLFTDGTFIVSTPNRLSRYRKSEYHVREYAPEELEKLLRSVFDNVGMMDFELKPLESEYMNPILAVCK